MTIYLLIAFSIFPVYGQRIVQLLSSKTIYESRKYKSIQDIPHIVLMGHVTHSAMFNFLNEYFHEDHDTDIKHCVVLSQERPDPETQMAIMEHKN